MKETDNTTTARIMPPRKVFQPIRIRLEELESVKEISESRKQRSER